MSLAAENPRAVIGGNLPPIETAIDRAKPAMAELGAFLKDYPVISTEQEARASKDILDRVDLALKLLEIERKAKTEPLRKQVEAINAEYHQWHNADKKRPGLYDKIVNQAWSRMSAYALEVERQRQAAAEAARLAAEEAAAKAREAEQREIEAATEAASGVCDVDVSAVTEQANEAFSDYRRADWTAQRATAAASKIRITGGSGRAVSLKDHETLYVSDWRTAIEDIGLTEAITDAILKGARAYRKENNELPRGIERDTERSL